MSSPPPEPERPPETHNAALRRLGGWAIFALLVTAGSLGTCWSRFAGNYFLPGIELVGCLAFPAAIILMINWAAERSKTRK